MLYQETVTRLKPVEVVEEIEVPEALVKLVNSSDKEYGRNGYHYMGCQRKNQGGATFDRLREYVRQHQTYCIGYGHPCNCPIVPQKEA